MNLLKKLSSILLLAMMLPIALWGHPGHDYCPKNESELNHLFTDWGHLAVMVAVVAMGAIFYSVRWRLSKVSS